MSGQHLYEDQRFDLELLPCEMNINRGNLDVTIPRPIDRCKTMFKVKFTNFLNGSFPFITICSMPGSAFFKNKNKAFSPKDQWGPVLAQEPLPQMSSNF